MYHLVAADSEDRSTEDPFAVGIDEYLHESLRFPFLARAGHVGHGHARQQDFVACAPGFDLRQAETTEWRVDKEPVDRNPVADFAIRAAQEIVSHDLVVVICSVREGAAPVAIAEGVDVLGACPKRLIDLDVAARVDLDPCFLQAEVIGVRHAPDGHQHVGAAHLRRAVLAIDARTECISYPLEGDAFRVETDLDSFGLENLPDRVRDVRILAAYEARSHLDYGHAAAKTAVHLPELESHVTASDDDQVFGEEVDGHQALVGQIGDLSHARHTGYERPAAHVDEEAFAGQRVGTDPDRVRVEEPRVPGVDRDVRERA